MYMLHVIYMYMYDMYITCTCYMLYTCMTCNVRLYIVTTYETVSRDYSKEFHIGSKMIRFTYPPNVNL